MNINKEHKLITRLRENLVNGRIERRDFLRYSTLLGLSVGSATAFANKVTGVIGQASASSHSALKRGGTLRLSMGFSDVSNPHALSWVESANVTTQVVETLTRINHENLTIPHLAKNWEVSEDLRTWTFHLRPEAKWRKGGRPFTADDVIWNIHHILDPKTGSSSVGLMQSYLLDEVQGCDDQGNQTTVTRIWDRNAIEKVDDFTVRFNLKIPYISLAEDLFFYCNVMLDPEEGGEFGVGSNGTGAFDLVELDLGLGRAVFKGRPTEDYYGFGPFLDTLVFNDLGDDPGTQLAAIISSQVDGLYRLGEPNLRNIVESIPTLQTYSVQTSATAIVQMKVKEKPFDDPRVRLAMRYAMDPDVVLKFALQGNGLPAEHHFVCPIHPAYAPLPKMERDPQRARRLLAEAGYPEGINIEMTCKPDPKWELSAVQVIKQQYAEAGINMKINVMPRSQFWDNWDKVSLGFVEWTHRPLALTVLSLGFRSGVPWNAPEYENPEFDRLLDLAGSLIDPNERRTVMKQIQTILQQDGPFAQPCWLKQITVMSKRVQNFHLHPQLFFFANTFGVQS